MMENNGQENEFDSDLEIGDQFMAVKPWLGAIKPPTIEPLQQTPAQPDEEYEIDFDHGYKSQTVRQNLFYNQQSHPVYMTAALGIILDPVTRTQKIFGGGEERVMQRKQQATKGEYGHSDDILALAMSADRTKVATGQVGQEPMIFIWGSQNANRLDFMTLPRGSRSVSALAFNSTCTMLAAGDMTDDYKLHIFDLKADKVKDKSPLLCTGKYDRKKI